MFKAVRDTILGWGEGLASVSRSRRTRRLVSLFLFEFVVVVAGVLVAQMLQERMITARNNSEAEEALGRSRAQAEDLVLISDYWLRVGPCLQNRVASIARIAAGGGVLDARQVGRPGLPIPSNVAWSEATTLVARRMHGHDLVERHEALVQNAAILQREQESIARNWALFALLDPTLGRPTAADRSNVRLAAAQVRASIRLIVTNARFLKIQAARMGIRPGSDAVFEVGGVEISSVVDDCGMLRQWSAQ